MGELIVSGTAGRSRRMLGYLVHLYTASGVICAVLAADRIVREDYAAALFWLLAATVIDGSDGTLARRFRVKKTVPEIDGRKLDDLVDFLNYSFLPLGMIARAGWLPYPAWLWAGVALIASLFAFANVSAKQEEAGFFVGFPSYWNVFAFYTAVWLHLHGELLVLAVLLVFSLASVLHLRFVYPTRARRWHSLFVWGSWLWFVVLLVLLWEFNASGAVSTWLVGLSLVYPALYLGLSLYLDFSSRKVENARLPSMKSNTNAQGR